MWPSTNVLPPLRVESSQAKTAQAGRPTIIKPDIRKRTPLLLRLLGTDLITPSVRGPDTGDDGELAQLSGPGCGGY
jgi:hypothetical protein